MLGLRLIICVAGVSFFLGLTVAPASAISKAKGLNALMQGGKGLFRSHEFRSTLKSLPHWTRVLSQAKSQTKSFYECNPTQQVCSSAALSWQKIINHSRALDKMDQIKAINKYFNRWPYRLDMDVYGVSDYWATPGEFLKLSGDCEDYSITKYYALQKLGFSANDMRIALLKDSIRNIAHAVLAVKLNGDTYILDNMTDMVLSHTKYEHYVPQYSVNEFYRWAHISPGAIR